jgi:hypothetical protein
MRKILCGVFFAAFIVTAARCADVPPRPYADAPPRPWADRLPTPWANDVPPPPDLPAAAVNRSLDARLGTPDVKPGAVITQPYAVARMLAIREGKPLAVWVRQPAVDVPGCVCVAVDGFPDDKGEQYVIVGKPDGRGDLNQVGFFHHATADDVKKCLEPIKATKPAGAVCGGGCGASCQCPATRGYQNPNQCTCAPQHRIYPPTQSAAPPPLPRTFVSLPGMTCGPRG